jgi:hypothetical protein
VPIQSIDEAVLTPDRRSSVRLFQFGSFGLFGAAILLAYRSSIQDALLIGAGLVMMGLGALPALLWARHNRTHFPAFEMFMVTMIPFYVVPLLTGSKELTVYSEGAIWQATIGTLFFQLTAITAFMWTKGRPSRDRNLTTTLLPEKAQKLAQAGLWLNTVYLYVLGFMNVIPYEISTLLRAIFFGLGTVAVFVEMRRWGAGILKNHEKTAIGINLFIQTILMIRDLYLITAISLLLLSLLGYVSTSRRIPLLLLVICLPVLAILHNGKSAMRDYYWVEGNPLPDLTELPAFFETWISIGLQPKTSELETEGPSISGKLFDRASLIQMLCLVADQTPASRPFLAGESYQYILVQLIPSFIWPDKPSSMLSNILLAIHYGLVSADSPASVSIAFGMVAESYANFGLIGCGVLGLVIGFGYKYVSIAALGCPQFSALGLLTILLSAWSFQAGQIFATWFVSLCQAAIVVIGIPMVLKILFRPG